MRRGAKYRDHATFHFYNANPFGKYTGDCVVRAISVATETDWEEVVLGLATTACLTGYSMCSKEGFDKYLENHGWVKNPQPRKANGKKYTGKEFGRWAVKNGIDRAVAKIGGHHVVAVIDGKVWDTWDSTGGCIGNYWTKGA